MKNIYFNQKKSTPFRDAAQSILKWSTLKLMENSPSVTLKLAEHTLCKPTRSKNSKEYLKSFQRTTLQVQTHNVNYYQMGNFDRSILFVHGWSGNAANFSSFQNECLSSGYNFILLDHIGHGNSGGNYANLYLFKQTIQAVINSIEENAEVAGVVAHSMGGSAAISLFAEGALKIPLVLISPVVPMFETFYSNVSNFGISETWVTELLKEFEKRYSMNIESLDPTQKIHNLKSATQIIHDRHDSYIQYEKNLEHLPVFLKETLITTDKLGHFRILKSKSVIEKSIGFIKEKSTCDSL